MAATGVHRVRMISVAEVRVARGRHRLGNPGLRHCRQHKPVSTRITARRLTRHAAPVSPVRLSIDVAVILVLLMVAGTVMVSGWYAAAGAAVVVDMGR